MDVPEVVMVRRRPLTEEEWRAPTCPTCGGPPEQRRPYALHIHAYLCPDPWHDREED